MNINDIKNDIDNVKLDIETPHDDSNTSLQEIERDNWGRILNTKTFNSIKENFRLIKSSVGNFLNEVNTKITEITTKITKIENDNKLINSSIETLKTNGSKINEEDLKPLANLNKLNIFKETNTFEKGIKTNAYNLNENKLAEFQGDTITIGDNTKSINIVGKDTKLLYNGTEIQGGNYNSGSGDSSDEFFIQKIPVAQNYTSSNVPYLDFSYDDNANPTQKFGSGKNIILRFNKTTNPILVRNTTTNSMVGDNIISGNVKSDNTLNLATSTLDYKELIFKSSALYDFFKDVLKVENRDDKINIKNLVGISFKLLMKVATASSNGSDYNYPISTSIFPNGYYSTEVNLYAGSNEYRTTMQRLKTDDNSVIDSNSILDKYKNSYIKSIKLDSNSYNTGSSEFVINIPKDIWNGIANDYNSGKTLMFRLFISEIQYIKLAKNSSGGSSSGGTVNFSTQLGVPVITYTNGGYGGINTRIYKKTIQEKITYNDEDKLKIFNGEIPLISDNVNFNETTKRDKLGYNISWGTDTYFIPLAENRFGSGSILDTIFKDDLMNIPLNSIYGFELEYSFKVNKTKDDNLVETIIDTKDKLEFRIVKGNATTLKQVFTTPKTIRYVNGINAEDNDWFNLTKVDYKNNTNSTQDDMNFYMKFNQSGAYNNCYVKNYQTNTEEFYKNYNFLYITNTQGLFDNAKFVNINFSIEKARILLKI